MKLVIVKASEQAQKIIRHPHCQCVIVSYPDGSQEMQTAADSCPQCAREAEQFNAREEAKRLKRMGRGSEDE